VGARIILADNEETDTIGSTTVFLGIHLGLCSQVSESRERSEKCELDTHYLRLKTQVC
jgi:hypothetical protein